MKNIFTYGKYKGQLVSEVIKTDPSYVCWAYENVPENGGVLPVQYDASVLQERKNRDAYEPDPADYADEYDMLMEHDHHYGWGED